MPRIVSILSALLLLLAACSGGGGHPALSRAEAVMEQHPDSALAILDSINPSALTSDASRAKYALLLTQAQTKTYQTVLNDSLISIALNYYADSSDSRDKMLSHYYYSEVKFNSGDYAACILHLFKALEEAEKLHDPFWLGMINRMLSDSYMETYSNAEELVYAKREWTHFLGSRRQPHIDYAINDLARAYSNAGKFDSAVIVANQAIDSAIAHDDPYLLNVARRNKGLSLYAQGTYPLAAEVYDSILVSGYGNSRDSAYRGLIYLESGHLAEARSMLGADDDPSNFPLTYLRVKIYKAEDSIAAALRLHEQFVSDADKRLKQRMSTDITSSLVTQLSLDKKVSEAQSRAKSIFILSVSALILMLAVVLIVLFRNYRRQQLARIEQNIQLAHQLEEMLDSRNSDFTEARLTIQQMMSTKYELLDRLCYQMAEGVQSAAAGKKISDTVNSVIKQISQNPKTLAELEALIDKHYDNLFSDFRATLPALKDSDYKLYLFSILGFSSASIAVLLSEKKVSNIYNQKRHLKDKIKLLGDDYASKFLKHL